MKYLLTILVLAGCAAPVYRPAPERPLLQSFDRPVPMVAAPGRRMFDPIFCLCEAKGDKR